MARHFSTIGSGHHILTRNPERPDRDPAYRGLVYRPLINLDDGDLAGFSAIAGTRYPAAPSELGALRPADPVGQACRDLARVANGGTAPGVVLVRAATGGLPLSDAWPISRLTALLAAHGVEARRLVLGFSVAELAAHPMAALKGLVALKRTGVGLFVDDIDLVGMPAFFLEMLPVDYLCLDLRDEWRFDDVELADRLSDLAAFAGNLLMDAVISGVETESRLRLLRRTGCRFVLGLYAAAAPTLGSCFEHRARLFSDPPHLGSDGG